MAILIVCAARKPSSKDQRGLWEGMEHRFPGEYKCAKRRGAHLRSSGYTPQVTPILPPTGASESPFFLYPYLRPKV